MKLNPRNRQILSIAVPSIVSNITVPLLGLIDTAIVGHMGDAAYIGAVAVGSMIFNLIYWLFAFLRMGTSGMTAQVFGSNDAKAEISILRQSLTVSLVIAATILLLQVPIQLLMFWVISPTPDVAPFATTYFHIVVWGAPAMLSLYSLNGWFIGMQNTRIPMFISIMQNVVNILTSLFLVYGLGMKVEGVAIGTVIAQYSGMLVAIALLFSRFRTAISHTSLQQATAVSDNTPNLARFFTVNRDIFLRTLCLVAVNLYFTSAGARSGAVILSVNAVLIQFYLLFSYFMDGFANAGEALCGRFKGAGDREAFSDTVRRLFLWGMAMVGIFTTAYLSFGTLFVRVLTDNTTVRLAINEFIPWACLMPLAGVSAFIWDGVFIGITATRGMLTSAFIATLSFFLSYAVAWLFSTYPSLVPPSNHFLWLSFTIFLVMRGILQTIWFAFHLWRDYR